ncbi:MAG TPA: type II toxin-antitoxin system VapC family toxin [Phycicoccus sp.]|mgnify:CR=1 FL=1|nr:type II toxin-antitoxin system VapC family toxin [Phycicoccus sp.]
MILVDTSIWIDHLHSTDHVLVERLERLEVGTHHWVIAELALGSMANRDEVLAALKELWRFPVLDAAEMLALVDGRRLWSRGLSVVDIHLLGAAALVPGAALWTRDKRLIAAGQDLGVTLIAE